MSRRLRLLGLLGLWLGSLLLMPKALQAVSYGGYDPRRHPPERVLEEALTVYWGNVARAEQGLAPLRWNRQLTYAARWFSWDSTENRPSGFCGHQDTLGTWPDARAWAFGYRGFAGAENAFCGYVSPQEAIQGWLNSPGHRANLLDPQHREVGIGTYLRTGDGRGYVTQDFGRDLAYAPAVLALEALTTTVPTVDLYVHPGEETEGFAGTSPAVAMRMGEDRCLADVPWQPFQSSTTWTLSEAPGWHTLYVQTRDRFGRTRTVSDTLYYGVRPPLETIETMGPATRSQGVRLVITDSFGLPSVELSLGWLADDTFPTFSLLSGTGSRVDDPDALGGTAFRLAAGAPAAAWVWDTTFYKNLPMVAYVRLKVADNTSPNEVVRISIDGGGTLYGPRILRGTDFTAPHTYQEFRLPFTFHDDPNHPFLILSFESRGITDVYVDAVTFFTAPQPVRSPLWWVPPDGNYRGQGVWARFSDGGGTFTPILSLSTVVPRLTVTPSAVVLLSTPSRGPTSLLLRIAATCGHPTWTAAVDAPWATATAVDARTVRLTVDGRGLAPGTYTATLSVTPAAASVDPVRVPITLTVVDRLFRQQLPLLLRP